MADEKRALVCAWDFDVLSILTLFPEHGGEY